MKPAAILDAMGQFPVVAGTAAGVLMGLNPLASVLRVLIEQRSRTRRFVLALENSDPRERPEIIAACGRLEALARPSQERWSVLRRQGRTRPASTAGAAMLRR